MDRLKIFNTTSVGSACALAGSSEISNSLDNKKKCKITVFKKTLMEDFS